MINDLIYPGNLHRRVLREAKFICAKCGAHGYAMEADHILPIILGGTSDRSNLRALCVPCHKEETAALARRRADARKGQSPMQFEATA